MLTLVQLIALILPEPTIPRYRATLVLEKVLELKESHPVRGWITEEVVSTLLMEKPKYPFFIGFFGWSTAFYTSSDVSVSFNEHGKAMSISRSPGMTLRLDKNKGHPDEVVRLRELLSIGSQVKISRITHEVRRVGRYDKEKGQIVDLDPADRQLVDPAILFDGLPQSLFSANGLKYNIRERRHKGIEFAFRPQRLGAFHITVTWHVMGFKEAITSPELVLVVQPPLGPGGKPVIKPEWLAPDNVEVSRIFLDGRVAGVRQRCLTPAK